ncbi:MAG: RNA polymerase sigma factor [Candidatus Binataceae bacterium]
MRKRPVSQHPGTTAQRCAEIAEVLDCPEGTVKTWLHRARRELADHLRRRGVLEETDHAVRRI